MPTHGSGSGSTLTRLRTPGTLPENPHICRVAGSLLSAESRALGKATICRVPKNMHSANNWHSAAYLFAECQPDGTRQRHTLPSASQLTLGKERHVHRQTTRRRPLRWRCFCLPSAYMGTLGNKIFAECPTVDTRQTLSRALHPPAPKAVTLLPRTFPFFHGRYRYASPSAKLGHSANIL